MTNVPKICGALVGARMATLAELKTVYSLEDAFMLFEILQVKNYNDWAVQAQSKDEINARQ